MRCLILLTLILSGSCALKTPIPDPPDRSKPARYTIPIDARNQDLVCVQTLPALPDYCRSVQSFRLWMLGANAN
jgi:hypothetical protein